MKMRDIGAPDLNWRWLPMIDDVTGPYYAHAINCHDDLVSALDTLIRYAQWQMTEGESHHPTLPSAVSAAVAVIAKANEE